MKKKLALILAALLCSAAVATTLVGCGNQQPTVTSSGVEIGSVVSGFSLKELREVNNILTALANNKEIITLSETKDVNGNTTDMTAAQYRLDKKTLYYDTMSADKDSNPTGARSGELPPEGVGVEYGAPLFGNGVAETKTLTIVSGTDYAKFVAALPNSFMRTTGVHEEDVECYQGADGIIVKTQVIVSGEENANRFHYYYVDESTKQVKALVEDVLDLKGNITGQTQVNYSANSTINMNKTAKSIVTDGTDTTELTIVTLDGHTESKKTVTVDKDTQISVYTPSGKKAQIYTARKNGNLQNEVSTVDLTDDKVTIYVSYTNA